MIIFRDTMSEPVKRLRTTFEVVVTTGGGDDGEMKFRRDICGVCGQKKFVMSQKFYTECEGDHNGNCLDCITAAFEQAAKSVYNTNAE